MDNDFKGSLEHAELEGSLFWHLEKLKKIWNSLGFGQPILQESRSNSKAVLI